MTISKLPLDELRLDGGTQPREEIDAFTVDIYTDALLADAEFPPIVVFSDGDNHWLADGFHRVAAVQRLERDSILAEIREGTQRDAILYALGANATHGKPRSIADKRRAVTTLLLDHEWSQWSDRQIARHCSVSHTFVANVRAELNGNVATRPSKKSSVGASHRLSVDVRDAIRYSAIADNPAEIAALASLEADPQAKIADLLLCGKVATVREAKQLLKQDAKTALANKVRAEPTPPPEGPFRVIVIDPPWRYDTGVEKSKLRGLADYPDMSVEEISALPIARVAHRDCVVWLWTTNAFMRAAFSVLDAWGFEEKTILTWDKEKLGVGHWLRNVTEHCILAVRGHPVVELGNQTTLIREPRREHSRKPDAFYRLVETLCPGNRLEVFARETRPGWTAWGAEMEKFDV